MSGIEMKRERWIAIEGCIYTEKAYRIHFPQNKEGIVYNRKSIAFNVGEELAKHIVELHNAHLLSVEHYTIVGKV